jgi:hypothetical protein
VKPRADLGEGIVVDFARDVAVRDRNTIKKKINERRRVIMGVLCRDKWRTGLQELQD